MRIDEHGGLRVQYLGADGPLISTGDDASGLIGDAWGDEANVIAIPVARLDPAFFDLSTGLAGEVTQKVVNYHLKLALIGDIARHTAASQPLADYVWESNRGDHIWFLDDEEALAGRLRGRQGG